MTTDCSFLEAVVVLVPPNCVAVVSRAGDRPAESRRGEHHEAKELMRRY